jgi:hypothetical protein
MDGPAPNATVPGSRGRSGSPPGSSWSGSWALGAADRAAARLRLDGRPASKLGFVPGLHVLRLQTGLALLQPAKAPVPAAKTFWQLVASVVLAQQLVLPRSVAAASASIPRTSASMASRPRLA